MPRSISILFVASEANPFIKTGSIGEFVGNLPKHIKMLGHDIRVMLPGYGCINTRRFQIHNLLRMKDIEVPVASQHEQASIASSYLSSNSHKVLVYFISNEKYFNRAGLCFDPDTKKYFPDNDERFIFFCRGVLETLKRLQWQPDIIHCNDWQCGLVPVYLKSLYKDDPYFRNVKTVFTLFSLASHASFSKGSYEKSGLPAGMLPENGTIDSDRLNFLKAGLTYADLITTLGHKAEKGLCHSPHDDIGKLLHARKESVVSMNGEASHNQELLAERLVDLYRELVRSN